MHRLCREMITMSPWREHGSAHMYCLKRKLFLQLKRFDFRNLNTRPIAFCEKNISVGSPDGSYQSTEKTRRPLFLYKEEED